MYGIVQPRLDLENVLEPRGRLRVTPPDESSRAWMFVFLDGVVVLGGTWRSVIARLEELLCGEKREDSEGVCDGVNRVDIFCELERRREREKIRGKREEKQSGDPETLSLALDTWG